MAAVQFTRAQSAGDSIETHVLFRDPVPLNNGKDATSLVAAMRVQWRSLRERGHQGAAVQGYTFDRCAIGAVGQLLMQLHLLLAGTFGVDDAHSAALKLLGFVVILACAIHDGHNGYKWSLPWGFNDADLIRYIIASAALRNSFDIMKFVRWS